MKKLTFLAVFGLGFFFPRLGYTSSTQRGCRIIARTAWDWWRGLRLPATTVWFQHCMHRAQGFCWLSLRKEGPGTFFVGPTSGNDWFLTPCQTRRSLLILSGRPERQRQLERQTGFCLLLPLPNKVACPPRSLSLVARILTGLNFVPGSFYIVF